MQQTSELSESEMKFRQKRAHITMGKLKDLLGDKGPTSVEETPTVALAISGGGYRAISTSCGAMEALMENKLFDALMYCVGLSGSVWYMSSTYSRKSFTDLDTLKKDHNRIRDLLGKQIEFGPMTAITYAFKSTFTKQNISLVDVFGAALRDVLLEKEHKNMKLSSLREYVEEAQVPFPIFSAANVRNNHPVIDFWEEVELTPFEATYASYRLLVPIEHVNSVWKNHILSEVREEPTLHYIMGFCGCAFAILLYHITDFHEKKERSFRNSWGDMLKGAWNGTRNAARNFFSGMHSLKTTSFSNEIPSPLAPVMSKEEFENTVWLQFLEKGLTEEGEDVTLDDAYAMYLKYMDSEDSKWIEDTIEELKKSSAGSLKLLPFNGKLMMHPQSS